MSTCTSRHLPSVFLKSHGNPPSQYQKPFILRGGAMVTVGGTTVFTNVKSRRSPALKDKMQAESPLLSHQGNKKHVQCFGTRAAPFSGKQISQSNIWEPAWSALCDTFMGYQDSLLASYPGVLVISCAIYIPHTCFCKIATIVYSTRQQWRFVRGTGQCQISAESISLCKHRAACILLFGGQRIYYTPFPPTHTTCWCWAGARVSFGAGSTF